MAAAIRVRGAAIGGAAMLAALIWSAPAHALGLANPSAAPVNLQAGANSDFNVHLDITEAEDQLKDLTVELPPGLGGNPQAVEKCPPATFEMGGCTAAHQVGTTVANATTILELVPGLPIELPALDINGTVYNLVPGPGEPARLGIELNPIPLPVFGGLILPPIRSQVRAELRPDDLGLNTILTDLPRTADVLGAISTEVEINSIDLSLFESFMFNPTSCNLAVTRFLATSWADNPGEPVSAQTAGFTPTGCASQAFAPTAGLLIDAGARLQPGEHPTVTTTVRQGPNEANAKHVELTLPLGLGPDLSVLLAGTCSQADFAARSCAPATRVGSAAAQTPLLDAPLEGSVYLVHSGQSLPNIGIDLAGALNVQLQASATVVAGGVGASRVKSILDGLPDLPLSRFDLTFAGGRRGLFQATSAVCFPTARLDGSFDSHGGQHVTRSVKPDVRGCGSATGSGVRCGGRRATRVGTRKPNVIRGTKRRDVIAGLGGNDVIRGLGGNDILCGGAGRDRLLGGRGEDRLFGRKGPDRLLGGPGRDRLVGGKGGDRLLGGPGIDRLIGGAGRDFSRQ